MEEYYEFPCGCRIKVLNQKIKDFDKLPHMEIDYYNLPLNCRATWDLIMSGKTQGIFQLETHLGKSWASKIKPDNLLEIAALTALIRPGCLNAKVDDKSLTQHYCDRKNGASIEVIHDSLREILKETYGILTYQEQSIEIAKILAGFNLEEADKLRRAMGKKDSELMNKVKKSFVEGCVKNKSCTKEEAEKIFSMIQAGERYSFNKSHGVEYGLIGYWTAYVKAHFPWHFFCAWLRMAKHKTKWDNETRSLVKDAKRNKITVGTPVLLDAELDTNFYIKDDKICFGISNIKKVGENEARDLLENIAYAESIIGKDITEWNWYNFLVIFADMIQKDSFQSMVCCGALNHLRISRSKMLHELSQWKTLPDGKKAYVKYLSGMEPTSPRPELVTDGRKLRKSAIDWACYDNAQEFESLSECLRFLLELEYSSKKETKKVISAARDIANVESVLSLLEEPPSDLKDKIEWVNNIEQEYMSTNITFERTEECSDLISNTTCEDFDHIKVTPNKGDDLIITGEVLSPKEHVIKSGPNEGKKMGFFDLEDETGQVSCVMFMETWEKYSDIVYEGNMVTVQGYKSDRGGLCVKEIGNAS